MIEISITISLSLIFLIASLIMLNSALKEKEKRNKIIKFKRPDDRILNIGKMKTNKYYKGGNVKENE